MQKSMIFNVFQKSATFDPIGKYRYELMKKNKKKKRIYEKNE